MAAKDNMMRAAQWLCLLAIVLMILCVCSCKTVQKTMHTSETKTVTIKQRDTTFIYQGASVNSSNMTYDSIKALLLKQRLNGISGKVVIRDSSGKVALSFMLDHLNRVVANCESAKEYFNATLTDTKSEYEKKLQEQSIKRERFIPWWIWMIIGGLVLWASVASVMAGWFIIKNSK